MPNGNKLTFFVIRCVTASRGKRQHNSSISCLVDCGGQTSVHFSCLFEFVDAFFWVAENCWGGCD